MTMIKYSTPKCMICKKVSDIELDSDKVKAWSNGAHIQNVWPELSADERELIMTGTHPACWDKLMSMEEED
jgi:hypothetical protein